MEARNSIEHDLMLVKLDKKRILRQYYMNLNTDSIEAHYEAEMQDKTNTKKSMFVQALDDVNYKQKDNEFQDKNK